jgi:hypothetical protein
MTWKSWAGYLVAAVIVYFVVRAAIRYDYGAARA